MENNWDVIFDVFKNTKLPKKEFQNWLKENYFAPEKRMVGFSQEKIDNEVYIAEQKLEQHLMEYYPNVDIHLIQNFVDSFGEIYGAGQSLIDKLQINDDLMKEFEDYRKLKGF